MNGVIKVALIGAIAVLLFDTVASFLALWFGAGYGWFSVCFMSSSDTWLLDVRYGLLEGL